MVSFYVSHKLSCVVEDRSTMRFEIAFGMHIGVDTNKAVACCIQYHIAVCEDSVWFYG